MAIFAVAVIGFAIPRWLIPTGMARFVGDPRTAGVAEAAYTGVWALNDHPLGRLLFPGARVLRVWRDPGHCSRDEPGGREPTADYRAEARLHGWFGIPGPRVVIRCGGWSYRTAPQDT